MNEIPKSRVLALKGIKLGTLKTVEHPLEDIYSLDIIKELWDRLSKGTHSPDELTCLQGLRDSANTKTERVADFLS